MNSSTHWDAIVIGSGLGGLSAAARFANSGKRVLVLERNASFGGAATVYRHGALTMEASLHETDGDTVFGPHSVFTQLGLNNDIEAIATDIFYEVRGGAITTPIQLPVGLHNALTSLCRSLPGIKPALETYFRELKHLYQSIRDFENLELLNPTPLLGLLFSGRLFELIADSQRTLSERFGTIFGESEVAKFALGAPISYFDDDPTKLSFLLFAGVWSRYVESGSYYIRGGSRALSMALLDHVRTAGGESRANSTVVEILLGPNDHAAGVRYYDLNGNQVEALAPIVFAGIAPSMIADMLPESKTVEFAKTYANFEPSISLFNISLGLSRPASAFGVTTYSTFIYPDNLKRFSEYPQAAAHFGQEPKGLMPPYVIADYGRLHSGLRQQGDLYSVSICGVDRLAWWAGLDEATVKTRKQRWIDAIIADVNRHYPGFASAVVQTEIATARTMKSQLGNPSGSVYGFRPTPPRLFGRLPSAATSIKGLWLGSAYTISGGYSGSMQGGLMAANSALNSKG